MKNDAMLDALRKKKGQGIDLTIILGDGSDGDPMATDSDAEDSSKLGLAPEVKDEMNEDGMADSLLEEEKEEGMDVPRETDVLNPAHADEEQDKDLIRKMLESGPRSSLGKMALASRKK